MTRQSIQGRGWAAALLMTALWFAVCIIFGYTVVEPAREAYVYEAICGQLAANATVGRQALVSSVWWPPLHVLIRLPLVLIAGPTSWPWVSLIVSAGMGALSVFLVLRAGNLWDSDWFRWLPVLLLVSAPGFIQACSDGSDTTTTLFATVYSTYSFGEWVRTHRLRALMRCAIGLAFILGTQPVMLIWAALLLVVLMLDLLIHVRERGRRFATLIMAILPLLYACGLWWIANWLIMGDGLYFLRSIPHFISEPKTGLDVVGIWHISVAAWLTGIGLVVLLARRRNAIYLVLAALGLVTLAAMFEIYGLDWLARPLLLCFAAAAAVAVAAISSGSAGIRFLGATSIVLVAIGLWSGATRSGTEINAAPPAIAGHDLGTVIRNHVRERSPYAGVIVCGYDGLPICTASADNDILIPSLDLDIKAIRTDYSGHHLFLLINEPRGRSAMDSIHWKFDRAYQFGLDTAIIDSEWGQWRLFELIQARPFL